MLACSTTEGLLEVTFGFAKTGVWLVPLLTSMYSPTRVAESGRSELVAVDGWSVGRKTVNTQSGTKIQDSNVCPQDWPRFGADQKLTQMTYADTRVVVAWSFAQGVAFCGALVAFAFVVGKEDRQWDFSNGGSSGRRIQ